MSEIISNSDGATPLDPDEMEGLIYTHIQARGQLDQLELINVQAGLRWLKIQFITIDPNTGYYQIVQPKNRSSYAL